MNLHKEVLEYIKDSKEFDPTLAVKIVNYQIEHVKHLREFYQKFGVSKVKNIDEIIFMPVEFFKEYTLTTFEKPAGYFVSSGTTGERSKVYFSDQSLELYIASMQQTFPFFDRRVFSLIPPFSHAKHSSLAFMVSFFVEKTRGRHLNYSFELDQETILSQLDELEEDILLFMTSIQLLKISQYMEQKGMRLYKKFIIVETGGYKALGKPYNRFKLYDYAAYFFPESEFYSEYGMSELFSQFYSTGPNKLYVEYPFAKVFTKGEGLLKVFDFANLYTVSALYIQDRIIKKGPYFDVLGRITDEERGCAFTFG